MQGFELLQLWGQLGHCEISVTICPSGHLNVNTGFSALACKFEFASFSPIHPKISNPAIIK
jgi:hypothetical protein